MDIRLLAPTATCVAIVVSIILWLLNQKRKELSYSVLWSQPLVNLRGPAKRLLDIRFKGEAVNDAQLILVKVWNSGHLPVTPGEYQSRLQLNFNPGAQIISANVIETHPADLDLRSKKNDEGKAFIEKIDHEKLYLSPILLNAGDYMVFQLVVRNSIGKPQLEGHIQGIAKVQLWKRPTLIPRILVGVGILTMAASMLLVDPSDLMKMGFDQILPFALMWGCGYIVFYAGWRWLRGDIGAYAGA